METMSASFSWLAGFPCNRVLWIRRLGVNLKRVKALLESATGTQISRRSHQGINIFRDIALLLPNYEARIVFDVGANDGRTSEEFARQFPKAKVYAFEPVADTFTQLLRRTAKLSSVTCVQLAFGSKPGVGEMVLEGNSDMFFLRNESEPERRVGVRLESVKVSSIDKFCLSNSIDRINYLKIDTEGGDLEVLKGAESMLKSQSVDVVQVEAGMNPANERHVPFGEISAFLELRGYLLFGLYEQVCEWPTQKPFLRRTNPVFISERIGNSVSRFN